MAYSFNDKDKEVKEFSERLPFGVHKVQLVVATADATNEGKEFIELSFVTEDNFEDTVRLWFVGGAANISFNTLHQIAVHNQKTEEKKEKMRQAMDRVADSEELVNLLNDSTIGGEFWVTKFYDPKRTYTNERGTFRSFNTNAYGYAPKERPELMPEADQQKQELNQTFPGAKEDSAGAIPDSWS